jgi:hypothetical protein
MMAFLTTSVLSAYRVGMAGPRYGVSVPHRADCILLGHQVPGESIPEQEYVLLAVRNTISVRIGSI